MRLPMTMLRPRFTMATGVLATLLVLSAVDVQAEEYWVDFSAKRTNMDVTVTGGAYTDQCDGCCRLLNPNRSRITGNFHLDEAPDRGTIQLRHLSSIHEPAKFRGQSPITIRINGHTVVKNYDPGHPMTTDSFRIGKYLRAGNNRFEIRFCSGTSHYWINRLKISNE